MDKDPNSIIEKINSLEVKERELEAERAILMKAAFEGEDPKLLIKAMDMFNQAEANEKSGLTGAKSIFLDPYAVTTGAGFLEKPKLLDERFLRNMARSPIIRAVIDTRVDQIAEYSNYVEDGNEQGWTVRPRKGSQLEKQPDVAKQRITNVVRFLETCGLESYKWSAFDFEDFLRKTTRDSLILDVETFEIICNRNLQPVAFAPTDAATYRWIDVIRFANSRYFSEAEVLPIDGYIPSICQVYDGRPLHVFYPWELSMGIRNQTSDIRTYNYGVPELEDLMRVVTWMLYSDEYNGRFFSQGSAPKGIIKLKGSVPQAKLNEFKMAWLASVTGAYNSHRTPVLEADFDWVDMQKTNREMEFKEWNYYLIAVVCALFKIAPEEIGFAPRGFGASMFGQDQGERLKYSKDKGLKPLLRFKQKRISKWLVKPLDPDLEFAFCGVDALNDQLTTDLDVKRMAFEPLNSILQRNGIKAIPGADDLILNPTYMQWLLAKQMGGIGSNQAVDGVDVRDELIDKLGRPDQPAYQKGAAPDLRDNPMMKGANKLLEMIQERAAEIGAD